MSTHIGAKQGDIAPTVLMPGDPLRAKFVAENFLTDVKCYNEVRGMYGYTGKYMGKEVSVQGSGMGIPSLSIYVNELIRFYDVQTLIRIGSCCSYQKEIKIRDIVLAMSSSTNSGVNKLTFKGMDFAPTADFDLLHKAYTYATSKGIDVKTGNILASDSFYNEDAEEWKLWASFQVLAVEMETSALYTLAAKFNRKALSVLTVSDSMITGEETTSEEREKTFGKMVEIALAAAV